MKNIETTSFLRANKLKITPSRIAILSLFSDKCNPLCAEMIFKKLNSTVDLVTIYRTLASFEEKGLIRRIDLHKEALFFELNGDHHHHHIVCTGCGKIEKLEKCFGDDMAAQAARHSVGFARIDGHSLEFFGTCTKCAKI